MEILLTLIAICLLLLIGIYLYCQNNWYKITRYKIRSNKTNKPITLVHLSDIHGTKLNSAFINKIKRENPNGIFITGDGIDSNRGGLENLIDISSKLVKISPVYYSLGNHESRLSDIDLFIDIIQSTGVTVLRNISEYNNFMDINIIGINDPAFRDYDTTTKPYYITSIYNKLIKNLDMNKLNLLLCHRPEILHVYSLLNVDLVLTGHGHGGQFRIPFIGGLFTPSEGFFPKYTSGIHNKNNTSMIISRGVGNSGFPFRINNRPEIIVINLI